MNGRQILIIAALAGGGYYLYSHRGGQTPAPAPSSGGSAATSSSNKGYECLRLAEAANSALTNSSSLLAKMPVDQSAWSSAESGVSSAISSAESACPGGDTAQDAVKAALSLMRASLGDMSNAARGAGGGNELARRQGDIDQNLDRARAALR